MRAAAREAVPLDFGVDVVLRGAEGAALLLDERPAFDEGVDFDEAVETAAPASAAWAIC